MKKKKKKIEHKVLLWEQRPDRRERDRDIDLNGEGYSDPVAAAAIRHMMAEQKSAGKRLLPDRKGTVSTPGG